MASRVSRTTDRTDRSDPHNPRDLRSLDGPDSLGSLGSLTLLIQRLLDAELLSDRDGVALLAQVDAARQSLEAGDQAEARAHLARIAHGTKRLIRRDVLPPDQGRAVVLAVHQAITELLTPMPATSPAPLAAGDSSPPLPGTSGTCGSPDPG
jgi:hypothetical protein